MSKILAMTPPERQTLLILASIYSLRMLGLFMILPVFAVYATQLSGVSPLSIGIALGIYGLTQAVFQIPFGYISDRLGRKPLIILGLLLLASGSVVAAMSQSILGVIVGRSIQGMGATGGVIMALLADKTREEIRLRAMAYIGISIGLSFALAFILGPVLNAWMGVQGIFWITALFSILAVGLVIGWLPSSTVSSHRTAMKSSLNRPLDSSFLNQPLGSLFHFRAAFNSAKAAGLLPLYVGVLILHASLTAVFLKIPQAVASFDIGSEIGNSQSWQFYLPVLLASFVLTILIILILEKTKKVKQLLAWVILLLGFAELGMLLFFQSFLGLSISLGLFFTAFNVLEASLPSLISKRVAAHSKGTALGIFSALQFLGLFIGGTIGGLLDSWGGLVTVFLFCVILAFAWFILMFHIDYKEV